MFKRKDVKKKGKNFYKLFNINLFITIFNINISIYSYIYMNILFQFIKQIEIIY